MTDITDIRISPPSFTALHQSRLRGRRLAWSWKQPVASSRTGADFALSGRSKKGEKRLLSPTEFCEILPNPLFLNEDSRLQGAVKCEDAFNGRPPLNSCMFKSLVTIEVSILVTPDFVDLFFVGAHQQLRVLHIAKMVLHFFRERSSVTCAQVIYW
jgi:hypothetical protein